MNSVCKELKPEGTQLFGTAVQKAITKRAETMSALSKTASKADYSSDREKFFRGGPTSGHGSGSGVQQQLVPNYKGPLDPAGCVRSSHRVYRDPPLVNVPVFQPPLLSDQCVVLSTEFAEL